MEANNDDIERAIQTERTRCVTLLELYRHEFRGTIFDSLWCRMRNQIAAGTPVSEAGLLTMLEDPDDENDEEEAK